MWSPFLSRSILVGAELDGKFYLTGGIDAKGGTVDDVLSFNPDTKGWNVEEKLESKKANHAAIGLPFEIIQDYCVSM